MKYLTTITLAALISACSVEPRDKEVVSEPEPIVEEAAPTPEKRKSWWKWIGAGVGAIAILLIADDSGSSSDNKMPEVEPKPEMPEEIPEEEEETPSVIPPSKMADPKPKPEPEPEPEPEPKEEDEDEGEPSSPKVVPKETEEDAEEEEEEEENTDEGEGENEMTATQKAWGAWNEVRLSYDITDPAPAPMYNGAAMALSGTKPNANYSYTGDIDGVQAPGTDHISDPKITLRVNDAITGVNAEVHWLYNNQTERSILSRYGARLNDDGTFSSFSMRDSDRTPADGNPSGFNGAFYDGASTFDAVAGHVATPRVYGTYKAEVE